MEWDQADSIWWGRTSMTHCRASVTSLSMRGGHGSAGSGRALTNSDAEYHLQNSIE